MKKLLITIALILGTMVGYTQEIKIDANRKYYVEDVVKIPNQTADSLLIKTVEWVDYYYGLPDTIIFCSKSKIIIKGNFHTNTFCGSGCHAHTLTIQFRDNRFKYNFTDFIYKSLAYDDITYYEGEWNDCKTTIFNENKKRIRVAVKSLTNYINHIPINPDDIW